MGRNAVSCLLADLDANEKAAGRRCRSYSLATLARTSGLAFGSLSQLFLRNKLLLRARFLSHLKWTFQCRRHDLFLRCSRLQRANFISIKRTEFSRLNVENKRAILNATDLFHVMADG